MKTPTLLALGALALLAAPATLTAQKPDSAASASTWKGGQKADSAKKKPEVKPKIDFSRLKFMEGCWRGRIDKDTDVEEIWTAPADNLLLATTRYLKKGRATGYEFTRIQAVDTTVVFAASSDGKPEDVYPLKALADEYVLFENPAKSFPKRIMYRLATDGALIPRNEGEGPSIELRMLRVKCPGADIKLRP
jgi:hypothetical protein